MIEEEWKPVQEWENYYQISNLGRLKALVRTIHFKNGAVRTYPERIRKGSVTPNGYLTFSLNRPGVCEFRYAHRMVAEAFLPNPESFRVVRHLDDIKTNNVVANLAWGTDSDNRYDAIRNGRDYWMRQSHCVNGHEYTEQNTGRDRFGSRLCRQCDRDRGARYRAKIKQQNG